MKKSLIAAAVAVSLSAPAMAQVSISGFFNASYDQFNVSQTSATRVGRSSENRVTDNSSRILFNVSEDLGGGMRALGQFDLRVAMDAMQPIAPFNTAAGEQVPPVNVINGGNNHVGLQTNMGTFRFGRQDIQYVENALFMPVGLATIASHAGHFHGTGIGTRSITGATRTPNLAWWVSPRWNGMQLTLGYSTNPAANSSFSVQSENDLSKAGNGSRVGSGTWVKLDAAIGNLAVVYSQVDMKPDYTGLAQTVDGGGAVTTAGGGANAQAWTGTAASNVMADEAGKVLTGKYNLGNGWNVGVGLARNKSTVVLTGVSTTNNATQIGVGYTSGAHQIGVGYTTLGDRKLSTTGTDSETGSTLMTLGYGYNLSKRTQLHASYVVLDNETRSGRGLFYNGSTVMGNAGALAGERHSAYSIGMRHSF